MELASFTHRLPTAPASCNDRVDIDLIQAVTACAVTDGIGDDDIENVFVDASELGRDRTDSRAAVVSQLGVLQPFERG